MMIGSGFESTPLEVVEAVALPMAPAPPESQPPLVGRLTRRPSTTSMWTEMMMPLMVTLQLAVSSEPSHSR